MTSTSATTNEKKYRVSLVIHQICASLSFHDNSLTFSIYICAASLRY